MIFHRNGVGRSVKQIVQTTRGISTKVNTASSSSNPLTILSQSKYDHHIAKRSYQRTPHWRYISPLRSKICHLPSSPLWFDTSNMAVRKLRILIKRFIKKWPLHSHPAIDIDYSDRSKLKSKSHVKRKLHHRNDLAIIDSYLFKDRNEIALCLKDALKYPLNPVDVNICLTACVIAQMSRRGEEIYRIATHDNLSLNFQSSSLIIDIFLHRQEIERASIVLVRLLNEHANRTMFDQRRSQQISDLISSFINSIVSSTLNMSGQDILNHFDTIFLSFSPSLRSHKSIISLSPFRSSHFDLLCSSSCVRHQLLKSPEQAHKLLQSISSTITSNIPIDHSQPSQFVWTTLYQSFVKAHAHRWIIQLYDISRSGLSFSPVIIGYDKLLLSFAAVQNPERFRSLTEEWLVTHANFNTSDVVFSAFLKTVFRCVNDSNSTFAHSLSSLVQSLADRIIKSINRDVALSSPQSDAVVLTGDQQKLIASMLVSLFKCGRRGNSLRLANQFAVALAVHPDDLSQHHDLFALNLSYHVMVAQTSSHLEPVFEMLSSQSDFFAKYPDLLHQIAMSCIRLCEYGVSATHSTEKSDPLLVRLVTLLESDAHLFTALRPLTLFTMYSHLRTFEQDSDQCIDHPNLQSRSNSFLRSIIKHTNFLIKHPQSQQFTISPAILRSDDLIAIIDLLLALASKPHLHHVVSQQSSTVLAQWIVSVAASTTSIDLSKRSFIQYLQQSPSQFHSLTSKDVVVAECDDMKSPYAVVLELPMCDISREQMLAELVQRGQSFLIDANVQCVYFLSGGIQSCLYQKEWARFDQLLINEVTTNKTTFAEKLWRRHEVRKRAKRIRDHQQSSHDVDRIQVSNKVVNKRPTRKTNVLHHIPSEQK